MQKKNGRIISAFLLSVALALGTVTAHADTLNTLFVQVDDSFNAYINTTDNSLGTLFLSCGLGVDNCTTVTTPTLGPGQNYFIQIVAVNDFGAGGLGATFTLSNGTDTFQNGGTAIDTSATSYWLASDATPIGAPWQTPTLSSYLENGAPNPPYPNPPGMIWTTGTSVPSGDGTSNGNGIPGSYSWNDQCQECQVDFSTEITTPVPEPGTLALLGSGLFGLGGTVRRRISK